jgi:hypothetical protein
MSSLEERLLGPGFLVTGGVRAGEALSRPTRLFPLGRPVAGGVRAVEAATLDVLGHHD